MKNILKTLVVFAATALVLNSCGEADPILYDGPTFVSFTDGTEGSYFVQSDNATYPIQVGLPKAADSDFSVSIEVVSTTATAGTHYDIPTSVTISKGEVVADIEFQGYFDELSGRKDTVVFQLAGDQVASFDTAYTVIFQQYCPLEISEFVGDWTANEVSDYSGAYDPYTVTFEANPNGGDTLITDDIWPYVPTKFVFDATDPANFFCEIPDQFQAADLSGYGEARIVSLAPGSFSACDKTISIRYKVYVAAGNFEQSSLNLVMD